jgi:hypothetical protein
MSVLVVGSGSAPVRALLKRLVSQGDEVRIVENDPGLESAWRSLGVHVARGAPDADLVERAAQNCRTLVVLDDGTMEDSVLHEVLDGAASAGVERVVVCGLAANDGLLEALRTREGQYVVLIGGTRRGPLRRPAWAVGTEDLARAVDAADDLGGGPRLELDLSEPQAWVTLGLDEPRSPQ